MIDIKNKGRKRVLASALPPKMPEDFAVLLPLSRCLADLAIEIGNSPVDRELATAFFGNLGNGKDLVSRLRPVSSGYPRQSSPQAAVPLEPVRQTGYDTTGTPTSRRRCDRLDSFRKLGQGNGGAFASASGILLPTPGSSGHALLAIRTHGRAGKAQFSNLPLTSNKAFLFHYYNFVKIV